MKASDYLDKHCEDTYALGDKLFTNPELGYKEFKTKQLLIAYFNKYGLKPDKEYCETGFSVSLGSGHPHIGLIAELDAIPTLGHKYANKDDNNAAHSCGHSTQCACLAALMVALKQEGIKQGKVTLFFTPAEEYTDLDYKDKLIKEKKIKYYGGKINMLEQGIFADVDMLIHLHMMSESSYHFSLGGSLGGFLYKEITFKGKAAHAAVAPDKGINALSAYNVFATAINALRETFNDEDKIRVHGIIKQGGQTVNALAEKVVYECYIRSINQEALLKTAKQVDAAAKHSSKAIGADCKIITKPGYLPFIQERKINDVLYQKMLTYCKEEEINCYHPSIASSDLGNVSVFIPCVEFGYGGFKGFAHSKDVEIVDKYRVYIETAKLLADSVTYFLENPKLCKDIKESYQPRMSQKEYEEYIRQK